MSLNFGAFEYARGVLRNWLEYYVKYDGYRFAETSQANSGENDLNVQYYYYYVFRGSVMPLMHMLLSSGAHTVRTVLRLYR
eukprot:SAG31_NODE_1644_length_7652_cov_2.702502_1_plen_81_part_00